MYSVKLEHIMKAKNFDPDQTLYINPMKLLPLERFINPTSSTGQPQKGKGLGPKQQGKGRPQSGPRNSFQKKSGGNFNSNNRQGQRPMMQNRRTGGGPGGVQKHKKF